MAEKECRGPTLADEVESLKRRVSALEQYVRPPRPMPVPWWVRAFPAAYQNRSY